MKRAALLAAIVAVASSCEAPAPPPPSRPSSATLDGAVARVGDAVIQREQVARIAAAQAVAPSAARDLAIHDALLAAEARSRGLDAEPDVQLTASSLLARALVQEISASAEAAGPVTDAELDEMTARHWIDLDRPEAARTVHAIVTLKKDAPADARAAAATLAGAIRSAVSRLGDALAAPAGDPPAREDPVVGVVRQAVNAVPPGGLDVRVESLPAIVADGRVVSANGGKLDPTFARAALQLERRGEVSPVIETQFGMHVIVLLERVPGSAVPRDERRDRVRDEVMTARAHREKEALLGGLRATAAIHRDVDALLALVPVER